MARLPWMQWYPADWFRDTKCLSFHAKGCWVDLIGILWDATPRGTKTFDMEGWSAELGKPIPQVQAAFDELTKRHICNIETLGNGDVTVMSRRQVREEKAREQGRSRIQRFRERQCNAPGNAPVTVENQKSEVRSQNQKKSKSDAQGVDPVEQEFEHWWERMPAKGGRKLYKAKALEFYRRYVKPEERADAIKAANAYAKHCRETDRIPCDPHRFLFGVKGELWRDFIPVATLTQAKVLNIREPVQTGPFVPPPKELGDRLTRMGIKIPGVTS